MNSGIAQIVLLQFLFLFAGCRSPPLARPDRLPSPSPQPIDLRQPVGALFDKLFPQLLADIGTLRGQPVLYDIPVDFVADRKAFLAGLHGATLLDDDWRAPQAVTWVALGFDEADVERIFNSLGTGLDSSTGYYNSKTKKIVLPGKPESISIAVALETLPHEITHALQDQYYYDLRPETFPDEDHRLAFSALLEGDANLTLVALAAARVEVFRKVLSQFLEEKRVSASSLEYGTLPRILADMTNFPYREGTAFVNAIYRIGRFPMVRDLFLRPPVSTAHILHPTKYLAGIQPVRVPAPALPDGFHALPSMRLGEFGMRSVLSHCQPASTAAETADGWAGDAVTIGAGPDLSLALLWSTIWDDELSAERFEKAVRRLPSCWHEQKREGGLRIANRFLIRRDGKRVVLVRGLADSDLDPAARKMLSEPIAAIPPKPNPLARVHNRFPQPFSTEKLARPGRIAGGRYSNAELGVTAELPGGYEATSDLLGIDLEVMRSGAHFGWGMFHVDSASLSEQYATEFFDGLGAELGVVGRSVPVDREIDLAFGRGRSKAWRAYGSTRVHGRQLAGDATVEMILVPTCQGLATINFLLVSRDEESRLELDHWMRSFAISSNAPACALLR